MRLTAEGCKRKLSEWTETEEKEWVNLMQHTTYISFFFLSVEMVACDFLLRGITPKTGR